MTKRFFFSSIQIKRDRITRLVVLPLYPQYSISTTGSSLRIIESVFRYLHCCYFLCFHQCSLDKIFHAFHLFTFRFLTGSCREDPYLSSMPVSIIRSWYQRDGYIKSMADLIQQDVEKFSKPEEVGFLMNLSSNQLWIAFSDRKECNRR